MDTSLIILSDSNNNRCLTKPRNGCGGGPFCTSPDGSRSCVLDTYEPYGNNSCLLSSVVGKDSSPSTNLNTCPVTISKEKWTNYKKPFKNSSGQATGCFTCNIPGWKGLTREKHQVAFQCLDQACGTDGNPIKVNKIPDGWCQDPTWNCSCNSLLSGD